MRKDAHDYEFSFQFPTGFSHNFQFILPQSMDYLSIPYRILTGVSEGGKRSKGGRLSIPYRILTVCPHLL